MHPLILAGIIVVSTLGNSMEPAIHEGQSIEVNCSYPYASLKVGDVVWFQSNGFIAQANWNKGNYALKTVHRIVRKDRWGHWHTEGDNNSKEDFSIVTSNNYLGKVIDSTLN